MRRAMTWGVVLAMVTGLVGGCADIGQGPSDPEALPQGITVLEAGNTSVSIAFKQEDVVIYFQALRGKLTPEPYQFSEDSPLYEVDARFVADNGRIFWTQRGGDSWIDPTWAEDLKAQDDLPAPRTSNRLLFAMAEEAAKVMKSEIVAHVGQVRAEELSPQLDAMQRMGGQAVNTFEAMKVRQVAHRLELGLSPIREIEYGKDDGSYIDTDQLQSANYYYIEMHTAVLSTALDLGCLWDTPYHSATRLYKWTGSWAFAHDSCNHGRCPFKDGMAHNCLLQYYDAVVDYKPSWTMQSCTATGYNAFSNDGHNCHDDTRLQLASFVYGNGHNKNPGTDFWCNGDDSSDISCGPFGGEQDGKPNCGTSTNRGYHHADMCRERGLHGYNQFGSCYCDQACLTYNDCCVDGPW